MKVPIRGRCRESVRAMWCDRPFEPAEQEHEHFLGTLLTKELNRSSKMADGRKLLVPQAHRTMHTKEYLGSDSLCLRQKDVGKEGKIVQSWRTACGMGQWVEAV